MRKDMTNHYFEIGYDLAEQYNESEGRDFYRKQIKHLFTDLGIALSKAHRNDVEGNALLNGWNKRAKEIREAKKQKKGEKK